MTRPFRPLALPRRLVEATVIFDRERRLLLELWLRGLDLPQIAAEAGLPEAPAADRLRGAIGWARQRLGE